MASNVGTRVASGTVEGTGATITVDLDFMPSVVHVYNVDGNAEVRWVKSMGAGAGYKRTATTWSLLATLGITPSELYELEDTGVRGFYIGADADVNASAETIFWTAWE